MMTDDSVFRFSEALHNGSPDVELVVVVPTGITDVEQLIATLGADMQWPSYMGHNWNAVLDCLCDLSWMDVQGVAIVHRDLPRIPRSELVQYVQVLGEAVRCWEAAGGRRLVVVFPAAYRDEVGQLLRSSWHS